MIFRLWKDKETLKKWVYEHGTNPSTPWSGAAGWSLVYKNMVDCVRTTVATEGVGALFLGIAPTVVRAAPNLGVQFLLYELLKRGLGY